MQSHLADAESARLEALFDCHVLDTPPEELFDQTARHAGYLCGTPIALIGFIDAARVWFKSRVGWEYPEIPRQDSICEHTIRQSDLLVITDAATDHRFRNGPIVTHAGIRFYAGAPLLTNEGYAVGTLCVMDCLPRELPAGHKESLITLAQLLAAQLEMRRSTARISAASEHKRTEDALRQSQDRLLGIISSAMDAIITVDDNQRIVVFNRAAEQIFRCPAEQALGQPLDKFIPLRFREAHRQHIRRFGDTGVSSRSMYSPGTLMGLRTDGEEFPVEATISQVKTASETLFTVILRDISVRKRTEDELRQAQKMEAVGHLAGGIAHEFNNYLGVIMGYSDLLGQDENQNESVRQTVAEINTATQRAASLTRQLLAFSRKQMLEPTVLDLNKSIHETHKLLRRLIPADIDIIPVLQPDLGRVRADPVQIQRILINLAVNARDAMPQGGKISIETVEVVLDEEFASLHPDIPQGDYVMLSVTDTGEGMDAETLSHIFEPFFTTKKEGKGTGLGLSTTYGIVKQSGGHVTVASVRGRGTTFRVYLPKLAAENSSSAVVLSEPAVHEREPIHEPALHTSGTILLVEDEPALRKLMRGTLEREGYTIVEAKDGAEALSICEQNPGIGLIVSDLAMPQMTGLELREKVAVMCPNMKFLLISGYVKDVVISPEQVAKFAEFLEKPFRPNELTQKVRELLTRTNGKQEEARGGNTLPEASHDKSGPGNDPRLN
jgi:two-component system cell cycle sensor histidine kinase/response regulator CckA